MYQPEVNLHKGWIFGLVIDLGRRKIGIKCAATRMGGGWGPPFLKFYLTPPPSESRPWKFPRIQTASRYLGLNTGPS